MVRLARASQTGVLHLECELGRARLAVQAGVPCAMTPLGQGDDCLGDALLREGLLDAEAHREAWFAAQEPPPSPVGAWLEGAGLVTRGALESTLRAQLRLRFCRAVAHRASARKDARLTP
jgi:hypothetical protein